MRGAIANAIERARECWATACGLSGIAAQEMLLAGLAAIEGREGAECLALRQQLSRAFHAARKEPMKTHTPEERVQTTSAAPAGEAPIECTGPCGQVKPADEFQKNRWGTRNSMCKQCHGLALKAALAMKAALAHKAGGNGKAPALKSEPLSPVAALAPAAPAPVVAVVAGPTDEEFDVVPAPELCPEALQDDAPPPATLSPEMPQAFISGLGTIRPCLNCGCLVSGGPTRCIRCAEALQEDAGCLPPAEEPAAPAKPDTLRALLAVFDLPAPDRNAQALRQIEAAQEHLSSALHALDGERTQEALLLAAEVFGLRQECLGLLLPA